ncbi:MBL fold metallo-hydrolase [Stieleria sp. TO1_6]|uniref:AVAST type 1 anti-phage system MBL fold metallo-hydrolase Avs1a n=1 Tax=Stieleria tagensis TaxID=2956795 RepID=UPI00209BAC66|nr:AVAST type 1 anti-phage system MBL fold metallo-hydrolase Avs1a [Stieleria tagensis]MCO8122894.1 MBL fold metallo-hydrolase [Stieleria tagensis]
MSVIEITMFSAGNGDCFLVECAGESEARVLIDGGFAKTFSGSAFERLRAISDAGNSIDLLICTHIDSDHIGGLIELLRRNESASNANVIEVRQVWHNSLRSLAEEKAMDGMPQADNELLQSIRQSGYRTPQTADRSEISAMQGSSLSNLIEQGGYTWNDGRGANPIVAPFAHLLNTDCQLTVLTPTRLGLDGLLDVWIKALRKVGYSGSISDNAMLADAFEFMCSFDKMQLQSEEIVGKRAQDGDLADVYTPDSSVTNRSSISFILEYAGTKCLFLGDAWAEELVSSLESSGNSNTQIVFDVIKLSHHGSLHNTSPELLNLIDSPRFLVSTDGQKHDHPAFEVLKAIVDRPADFERSIFFNYETDGSTRLRAYRSKSGAAFSVHVDKDVKVRIQANV